MRGTHLPRACLVGADNHAISFYGSVGVTLRLERPKTKNGHKLCAVRWILSEAEEETKESSVLVASAPVWADVLTRKGEELKNAKKLEAKFGWRLQEPIRIPTGDFYITMFAAVGELRNGNKVCGVLPKHLLIPEAPEPENDDGSIYLPFFPCASREDVAKRAETVQNTEGAKLLRTLEADGTVAICQDTSGAYFALYHRTDDPMQIKPGTKLMEEKR